MHLSPYCLTFRYPEIPDQVLLFSTKTTALALVPDEEFQAMEQGQMDNDSAADLAEMGILTSDSEAERQDVLRYLEDINLHSPNLTLALVLGMECNFRCTYCFEGQQKDGGQAMTEETIAQLVTFIKKHFTAKKTKLVLQIYGGEPLLYTKSLIDLAQRIQPFLEERGAEMVIDLVSNGSLLTEDVVDALNPWGLDGVKVTVDGPPDNHNHFRPFKSGAPSFDIIARNLAAVAHKTNIRLGGNYTKDTFQDFATVLDILAEQGLTPDKVERVNFNMVMQVKDEITGNAYKGGCGTVNEPWLWDASLHVREEVFRRGYPMGEISPEPCAVEMDHAFTVHYDGSLYKCVTWIGHEQFKIGDIWQEDIADFDHSHYLFHWQKEERCRNCVYLPLCFGGCRYMAYQRDGHMGNVDCKKPFLEAILKPFLLQDLRYRYGIFDEEE